MASEVKKRKANIKKKKKTYGMRDIGVREKN